MFGFEGYFEEVREMKEERLSKPGVITSSKNWNLQRGYDIRKVTDLSLGTNGMLNVLAADNA